MEKKQALIVGINNYLNSPELIYARHDATEFSSALELPEYGFETELLLDQDATIKGIEQSITALLQGDAPTKLLFFAGHGCATDQGIFLVAADDTEDDPGVSFEWLRQQITSTVGTVILVLDCCHSGGAGIRARAAHRWISEGDLEHSIGALGEGKILLAACTSGQVALELDRSTHGVFTFHLLEGLMGQAANPRGVVTPFGLFDYVAGKLGEEGFQTPVFKGEQAGAIILGAGFAPPLPYFVSSPATSDADVDSRILDQLETQAMEHLNDYMNQTSTPYEMWKTEGFYKATQLLEPILRWFRRTVSENPGVLSRSKFSEAYSEAKARLIQLGALSEGTSTGIGRVDRQLGSGAFGTVWKIVCPDGRELAYKVYHSNEIDIRDKVARFERGYRAMKQLEHPHIVKVHRYTNCPIGFYMDFVNGPNLRDFVGAVNEPSDTLELLIKVAETLHHAHGRNVIHRDVKPENIVLGYDTSSQKWVPYLTDFDLAWFSSATQFTKEALGAIYYAAPEQLAKPSSRIAHAPTTDVYSFGQLCFFAATGSDPVPFGGADNLSGFRGRIGDWRVEQAANIFADLYDRCTKQDPNERIKDFRTISDALFEAHRLLGEVDIDQSIDQERFFRELKYALAGLSDDPNGSNELINSLSGRTLMSVERASLSGKELDFTIRLEHDHLSLPGATSESSRRF